MTRKRKRKTVAVVYDPPDGFYIQGVPHRPLTQEEVDALPSPQRELVLEIYTRRESNPESTAADAPQDNE